MDKPETGRPIPAQESQELGRLRGEVEKLQRELGDLRSREGISRRYADEGLRATRLELEERTHALIQVNKQLQETQQQLTQSAKMAGVGTIAGGVAHEINNPLVAILTNAQVLLMTETDPEKRRILENIQEGARRCREIAEILLRYSRKSSPKKWESLDMNKILKETCALLEKQFSMENVEIEKRLRDVPSFPGNANELQQVFTNLLLNAKDAILSVRDKGSISLHTACEGKDIVVQVTDDGCGIPEGNLQRVFDPFFTTKDVGQGTGLGLSIAAKIVEGHGGTLTVRSQPGGGATFTIRLPMAVPS